MVCVRKYLFGDFYCRYKINGLDLGETKVIFYSGYNEQLIKSQTVTIQVSKYKFFIFHYSLPRNYNLFSNSRQVSVRSL